MSRKIKSKFDSEIEIIAIEKPHTSIQETFAAIESINRRIMEERLSKPIAPIINQQPNQQTTQTS
ncbi:MAG: hypothetical protein LBR09_02950 [Endomicrobium sp.]|jgi:hypothetical protein|nr:hypothetical protein [Endomicrobium sp.]